MTNDSTQARPDPGREAAARLNALIGQPDISAAYVRFRVDLLALQAVARRAIADASPLRPAAPLPVGPADVAFPADVLGTLLDGIRESALRHGQDTPDLQRLIAGARRDPQGLSAIAAAAAFGPDLPFLESVARSWGVLTDAVLFVGRTMAAPCVAEAVRDRVARSAATADAHHCPACQAPPGVARLRRGDGHRILTCGLCGHEWEATRLACACCGMQNQALLGVLALDAADARWIDTCDACRGYIKTVDERRLPDGEAVLPVVEESATLHLDLLAEREGYVRRVPYALAG